MKDEILFYENQPFWRSRIMVILTIVLNAYIIGGFIRQVFFHIPFGNNPTSNLGLGIIMAFTLLLLLFLLFFKQHTIITKEGISVQFTPLNFKTIFFAWEDIEEAYIRKYKPMKEFGGWGMRYQFFAKKGMAYNVSGNMGLQLVLNNGKKILIGTNNWVELEEILTKLNDKKQ